MQAVARAVFAQIVDLGKAAAGLWMIRPVLKAAEIRKLHTYYDDFRGWAEEFDAASLEMKRMILSHLIDRVEVGRKYQVTIKLNMEYQQLLDDTVEAICEKGLETQRK